MNAIKMTIAGLVASVFLGSTATVASDAALEPLFGEWGNASHCARELITPGGTKHFTPYEIQRDWLGHGGIWCRLIWSTVRPTADGMYAIAGARCGEDTVRDYQINFDLRDGELTVRWNQDFENGPLRRCER